MRSCSVRLSVVPAHLPCDSVLHALRSRPFVAVIGGTAQAHGVHPVRTACRVLHVHVNSYS